MDKDRFELRPRTYLETKVEIPIPTAMDAVMYGVNAVYMQRIFGALIDEGYTIEMSSSGIRLYEHREVLPDKKLLAWLNYPDGNLVELEKYLTVEEKDSV